MISAIWEAIKSWARWVYDWITVLVVSLVGLPTLLLELLNALAGVDITPLVGADKALEITTSVALVKAILALLESRMKPSA